MSKGIEVSPKHGLNPTIPVCFFCGEEKNEIALLGRIRKKDTRPTAWGGRSTKVIDDDVEAPMKMVMDYEPCDKCKEQFDKGVLLIGVTTHAPDGRPPLTAQGGVEVYPTGAHAVMLPEAVERVFNMTIEAGGKLFVDHQMLVDMLSHAQ